MISRLNQLLQVEGMSKSEFAERLDVAPATISHLLSGRNKPSCEIIRAIGEKFPELSLDWLINGNGKMFKNDDFSMQDTSSPGLFDSQPTFKALDKAEKQVELKPVIKEKSISKIMIFFTDGTFQDISVK